MEPATLKEALDNLGSNINNLTEKVQTNKQRAEAYKQTIIASLENVIMQLEQLKQNQQFKDIPQLRSQLNQSQQEVMDKTAQLAAATETMRQLQAEKANITDQLNVAIQQLDQLQKETSQKDAVIRDKDQQIQQTSQQINELTEQKRVIEDRLKNTQTETDALVGKIGEINNFLSKQIKMIDTIMSTLDDNKDTESKFEAVKTNIAAIMNMVNNPSQGSNNGPRVGGKKIKKSNGSIMRKKTIKRRGKKGAYRTTKRRTFKGRAFKGGYVYSSNKDLDNASLEISETASLADSSPNSFSSRFSKKQNKRNSSKTRHKSKH